MLSTLETLGCRRLTEGPASEAWDAYCRRHPDATPYHLTAWSRAVFDVLEHESFGLYTAGAQGITGVLPLHLRRSALFGTNLISVPAANECGPLADDPDTARRLIDGAIAIARDLNVDYLEIRSVPAASAVAGRLRLDPERYVSVVIDLEEGEAAAWSRLRKENRRRVRRAEDAGLVAVIGDDVDAFYPVYAASVKRLGSPPFSRRFFEALRAGFGDELRIGLARRGSMVAAVDLMLSFRGVCYSVFAGSRADQWDLSPNQFLLWAEIRDACSRGIHRFDLGRSLTGSGSLEFKLAWGGRVVPLVYGYHLQRARELPIRTPDMRLYRVLGSIWSRLPDALVTSLGPRLVRHLF